MEDLGVIARVNEPTDWCSVMVPVPKKDGRVRICVDLTKLNQRAASATSCRTGTSSLSRCQSFLDT